MGEQRHIIKRQVVEVRIDDAASAHRVQTEVGRIYRERIVPLIERYCSRLSAPDIIDRIDRLELDVGHVDTNRLEQELVRGVEAQLEAGLMAKIGERFGQAQGPSRRTTRKTESQLELFEFFARTGTLPWWADPRQPDLLGQILENLLGNEPERLFRSVRRLARQGDPLRRLVRAYADEHLAALLSGLLSAGHYPDADSPSELIDVFQNSKLLETRGPGAIRHGTWYGLFQEACGKPGSRRDGNAFLDDALVRIAAELRLTNNQLVGIAQDYRMRRGATSAPVMGSDSTALRDAARALAACLPSPFGERLNRLTAHAPADTIESGALQDFLLGLPGVLGPGNVPTHQLQKIVAALRHFESRDFPPEFLGRLIDKLGGVPERGTDSEPWDAAALPDLGFSETDRLYVSNAGLVILWPFLESFFERLDLLRGKRFKDDTAMLRACFLLQVLVDESPAPPEFVLPLNKILCGMDVDALFEDTTPATGSEVEECRVLLEAVIEHADVLKNTSVAGFREAFLARQGSLGRRDGAWLLRVEQETHDVLLERFPWSIEWVKLPWMTVPLRVEW